jgi:hypothetical protein
MIAADIYNRGTSMKMIRGRSLNLHKIVFDLRYLYGYTYLDRCGKTINAIIKECPEWVPSDQASPQNTPLMSMLNGCLFNFSSIKMDFSIEQSLDSEIGQSDLNAFMTQVGLVSRIVIDQLSLKEFLRVGLRAWYIARCESKPEAEKWLASLEVYSISDKARKAFGEVVDAVGIAIVIAGEDRMYRLSLNGVERSGQIDRANDTVPIRASMLSNDQKRIYKQRLNQKRNPGGMPQYAAMIDIDAYQENPYDVDPRDFAESSLSQFGKRLEAAVLH